jgi:hypothetical protein
MTSLGLEKKQLQTQANKMRSVFLDRSPSILFGVEEFLLLVCFGFDVSQRTISRWMGRVPGQIRRRRWLAFLRNRRNVIRPTTSSPFRRSRCKSSMGSSSYSSRSLTNPAPPPIPAACGSRDHYGRRSRFAAARYLIFDSDANTDRKCRPPFRDMGLDSLRTPWRSPCQNGVAELHNFRDRALFK